jgi:6-pyruvoyltetrahydropterin/6-carboxytetrahydropterin synthase
MDKVPIKSSCRVSRKVYFSAASNMAVKGWSNEKNVAVFGSLYSPHGYGHNYTLEVTVEGPIQGEMGMVINLRNLDEIMKEVSMSLDHRYINLDVPEFETQLPSLENLARYCYEKINPEISKLNLKLYNLRLYQSDEYWADVSTPKGNT